MKFKCVRSDGFGNIYKHLINNVLLNEIQLH